MVSPGFADCRSAAISTTSAACPGTGLGDAVPPMYCWSGPWAIDGDWSAYDAVFALRFGAVMGASCAGEVLQLSGFVVATTKPSGSKGAKAAAADAQRARPSGTTIRATFG